MLPQPNQIPGLTITEVDDDESEEIDYTNCYYDEDNEDDYFDYPYEEAINQPSYSIGTIIYNSDLEVAQILRQQNTIVLASKFVLIADIDCGNDIEPSLNQLREYVDKNGGTFKVYKTKHGMRYIQTNCFYQGVNNSAIKTLVALGSDPKYIRLCKEGGQFMARLVPKLSQEKIENYYQKITAGQQTGIAVCHYLEITGNNPLMSAICPVLTAHDDLCQSYFTSLPLS